jgi:cytidylate kinase
MNFSKKRSCPPHIHNVNARLKHRELFEDLREFSDGDIRTEVTANSQRDIRSKIRPERGSVRDMGLGSMSLPQVKSREDYAKIVGGLMSRNLISIEKLVAKQAYIFDLRKALKSRESTQTAPFITVSRAFGCSGFSLGMSLLDHLNSGHTEQDQWSIFDRRVFDHIEGDTELNRHFFEEHVQKRSMEFEEYLTTTFGAAPSDLAIFNRWSATMRGLASAGRAIFVGRASWLVTKHLTGGIHLRVEAPLKWRSEQYAKTNDLSFTEAQSIIRMKDRERKDFISRYFDVDPHDHSGFHLVLNEEQLGQEMMQKLILLLLPKE